MTLRPLLFSLLAFICLGTVARAQTSTDPNEGSQLNQNTATGVYTFSWWGRAGRTYFIQQSNDLLTWIYLPVIESGTEQPIQWSFTSNQSKFFARLKYTDIATNDPFDDDFDGDGISNWDELQQGTDPLAANLDTNGLPLDWEQFYGIAPGTNPNAAAPRGDGLTYLQAFQQGLNPNSSEGEQPPVLYMTDGYDQSGSPGSLLPTPLSIEVVSPKRYTAPLTFTVTAGTALLCADSSGSNPATTVTMQASTPWINESGSTVYLAQVYMYLPVPSDRISTITVTAPSGTQTTSVSTQVFAFDPSVQPPTGFGVDRVDATTADLSWTPSDPTLPTNVEVSYDYGSTWSGLTSFDPGVTTGTVYHLTPDQQISLRTYASSPGGGGGSSGTNAAITADSAGGGSGSGSAPSDPTTFTPLSVPVVIGQQVQIDARNWSYVGFQTPTNRYLRQDDHAWSDDLYTPYLYTFWNYPDVTWTSEFPRTQQGFYEYWRNPTPWNYGNNGGVTATPPYYGGRSAPIDYGDSGVAWSISSDTYKMRTLEVDTQEWGLPDYTLSRENTLSELYSLDQFQADVEGWIWPFQAGAGQDGCATAGISFTADNEAGTGEFADQNPTATHHYVLSKLQYSFACNQDPNGQVVYDIVFTPYDGSDPVHDVHVIDTNGKTVVPDQPIVLDPSKLNNKQNGTYQVIPIALQPDDWVDSDDDDGDDDGNNTNAAPVANSKVRPNAIAPSEGQTPTKGSKVISYLGTKGQKHFVSPEQQGDMVTLRAQLPKLPKKLNFADYFAWVQAPGYQINGNKISVPRDTPGKYPVQVKSLKTGKIVDTMNVWIVWAGGSIVNNTLPVATLGRDTINTLDGSSGGGASLTLDQNYQFKFVISPNSITDINADIPDLTGSKDSAGDSQLGGLSPYSTNPLSGGATMRWDVSRRVQYHFLNPNLIPYGKMTGGYGTIYQGEPQADLITIPFPSTSIIGNDDSGVSDEDNDPYVSTTTTYLAHNTGEITSLDSPNSALADAGGAEGDIFEEDDTFQEFSRLEIGKKWYNISDPVPWKLIMKLTFHGGQWIDSGSTTGTGN